MNPFIWSHKSSLQLDVKAHCRVHALAPLLTPQFANMGQEVSFLYV